MNSIGFDQFCKLKFDILNAEMAQWHRKSGYSKSIFYVKKRPNLSKKILKNVNLGPHFLITS